MEEGRTVRGTSSTCLVRIMGESYPWPCSSLAGSQQEPLKHTLCNARAAKRAAGKRQTNPDLGGHSFIAALSNTRAGTALWSSTQTHRKWGLGALDRQRRLRGHPRSLSAPREGRKPCASGRPGAGRGGLELKQPVAGHHRCPCARAGLRSQPKALRYRRHRKSRGLHPRPGACGRGPAGTGTHSARTPTPAHRLSGTSSPPAGHSRAAARGPPAAPGPSPSADEPP